VTVATLMSCPVVDTMDINSYFKQIPRYLCRYYVGLLYTRLYMYSFMCVVFILCILIFHDFLYFVTRCD